MKIVAILNITPDSFSDGGSYNEAKSAAKQLESILEHKPDVVDIGAVSTRPNCKIPTVEEEIERFNIILPTISPILKSASVEVSIDSYNPETISYLAGKIPIHWINDQSGLINQQMINLVKELNSKIVVMHHLTIPANPKVTVTENTDIVNFVSNWLLGKAGYLLEKGIKPEQIILDPGIGFGKTAKQSWELVQKAKKFAKLDYPVMYGHSRKSFFNLITDKPFSERDLETAVISTYLANCGVDYIRVHDVETNIRALQSHRMLDYICNTKF